MSGFKIRSHKPFKAILPIKMPVQFKRELIPLHNDKGRLIGYYDKAVNEIFTTKLTLSEPYSSGGFFGPKRNKAHDRRIEAINGLNKVS